MIFQGDSVLTKHHAAVVGGVWGFLKRKNGLCRRAAFLTVRLSAAFYRWLLWKDLDRWFADGVRLMHSSECEEGKFEVVVVDRFDIFE